MFSYNIPLKTNDRKHQENDKGRFDKQRLREIGILLHSAIIVRVAHERVVSLAWKFKVQRSRGDKTGRLKNFLFFLACNSSNVMSHFTCPHLALSVSCWYWQL